MKKKKGNHVTESFEKNKQIRHLHYVNCKHMNSHTNYMCIGK
jgi:hypothetical protein